MRGHAAWRGEPTEPRQEQAKPGVNGYRTDWPGRPTNGEVRWNGEGSAKHANGERVERRQSRDVSSRRGPGRPLRVLAGIDETILDRVPSERPRYTALGGVVLGTAVIAAFSMWTALHQVLDKAPWTIILPALIWGLFVLNLDRWLVSSSSGTGLRSRASVFVPRLIVAILFGLIIAEPLVLRIFETAVEERVREDRQQELVTYGSQLEACNPVPDADGTAGKAAQSPDCSELGLVVEVPTASSLQVELDRLREQETSLARTVSADKEKLAALNEKARLECNGTPGPGLTGLIGEGPNCARLRTEADDYRATNKIDQNVERLGQLGIEIRRLAGAVRKASENHEQRLQSTISAKVAERASNQREIGLLERFEALGKLTSTNTLLKMAVLLITLFFITIDCLPVIVKFLSGTTHYERMVETRLVSREHVFGQETKTSELERTAELDVERDQTHASAQIRKDEIADTVRLRAAERDAELNARIDELTSRNLQRFAKNKPHPAPEDETRNSSTTDTAEVGTPTAASRDGRTDTSRSSAGIETGRSASNSNQSQSDAPVT
jgi:Domain of unknown function (DUF4407)